MIKSLRNALQTLLSEDNWRDFNNRFGKNKEMMKYFISLYHHCFKGDANKLNEFYRKMYVDKDKVVRDIDRFISEMEEYLNKKKEALNKIKTKIIINRVGGEC